MNYGKILSVGFKVLVAAVAGVAVFIGVDKINTNNGNQNGGFRQKVFLTIQVSLQDQSFNQITILRSNK